MVEFSGVKPDLAFLDVASASWLRVDGKVMRGRRAVVLGCGLVGETVVRDLVRSGVVVTVADVSQGNLGKLRDLAGVHLEAVDVCQGGVLQGLVREADIVVGALPSLLGYRVLDAVIACGKPYCDISFMGEDPLALDAAAKAKGVTAVVDCGVAPGLANMIIGHCTQQLEQTEDVVFYVGGLPRVRRWPFEYQAPFAPSDVLEEYTRVARVKRHGQVVATEALSECELIDFPEVGTLEAFNTDGLRSLLHTIDAPNVQEKTLRYPGHVAIMRILRHAGFLSSEPQRIGSQDVRPMDVTAALLARAWARGEGDDDLTLLVVRVRGRNAGKPVAFEYTLLDRGDVVAHAMARTTAFPCTIVAGLVAGGVFCQPGVHPPERVAQQPGVFSAVLAGLGERGVQVRGGRVDAFTAAARRSQGRVAGGFAPANR